MERESKMVIRREKKRIRKRVRKGGNLEMKEINEKERKGMKI